MSVLRPEVCVGAVVVEADRLLLVRRGRGTGIGLWSVPGGRVQPGEPLAVAVVREVEEETRLRVVPGPWLGWVERIGSDHHYVIHDCLAALAAGQRLGEAEAGDDAAELLWTPLAELAHTTDLVPGLLEFLQVHGVAP